MSESQEQEVLIGDRQLMAHTDRARTTVRDWYQRPDGALPFTLNENGHRVFKVAEVDAWLASNARDRSGYSELGSLKQELLKLKIENRGLIETVARLETKQVPADTVGRFVGARETVRRLMRESLPDGSDNDLSRNDAAVLNFFDKVQAHLKLKIDTVQTNQELSA